MITADNITDNQIVWAYFAGRIDHDTYCVAMYDWHSVGAMQRRRRARQRCADIINATHRQDTRVIEYGTAATRTAVKP